MTTPESHPQIVLAMGGAWHESELLRRGFSSGALAVARRGFGILAWKDRFGGWHYPKWQFDADCRVLREVTAILRMFKSRDTLYVMGQFLYPQDGHQALIELIRSGRGDEAVALARNSVRGLRAEPGLTPREVATLKRRLRECRETTRYVVVSALFRRWVLVFNVAENSYCGGYIGAGCLIKDRQIAAAIASKLRDGKRTSDLHVIPVRATKGGYRALADLPGGKNGKPWRPRFRTPDAPPVFVAITPAGTRENIIDAMLFGAQHREAILSLVSKSPNRRAARRVLVDKCGLSPRQAEAILDLRLTSMTATAVAKLTKELRNSVAGSGQPGGGDRE